MGRFRVDDPEIDIAALEARVEAAIEAKLGHRFTAAELEELRRAPLRPRLRREDLPRGLVEQLGSARARLPEIEASPGPVERQRGSVDLVAERQRPPRLALAELLDAEPNSGWRGRLDRLIRKLARPATNNIDAALSRLAEQVELLADRDDRYLDALRDFTDERVERTADGVKDAVDRRVDATADWVGQHLSGLTGTLERRYERLLHLTHNLVFELTNARLDQENMQARINEMARRMTELEERERALQRLTLRESVE